MRERKVVKLRVDMYSDTKSKIIDMKPERDLIHYVWIRLVTLAGKVNLEGDLYMSKNIPYTIEILAIEFNRDIEQIKLALDVLMELEMMELSENNIYRVKNFAKHQNIKTKEKSVVKDEGENMKIAEVQVREEIENKEGQVKEKAENEMFTSEDKGLKNKVSQNKGGEKKIIKNEENIRDNENGEIETANKNINKIDNNVSSQDISLKEIEKNDESTTIIKVESDLQEKNHILLETRKNKKTNKKKKKDDTFEITDEEIEDNRLVWISDGDAIPLGEGECVLGEWSF